jgi:PTS system mannose-specific IID component
MFKVYGKMFFKTFFIQALWNFERLQNIGFLFVLKPFLDKVYLNPDRRKEALMRHTGFFNTHPYMANIIIAITANAEKEIAVKEGTLEKLPDINFIKSVMAGPLAAIGDSFFWGTLRPFAAFLSIFFVILFSKALNPDYSWIAPFIFLFAYNCVHIPARYWFLFISFKLDKEMLAVIPKLEIKFFGDMARYTSFLLVVASLVIYFKIYGFSSVHTNFLTPAVPDALVFGVVLAVSTVLGRMSATFMFYSVVLLCVLMSYLGL